jgi:hypothetical protein
MSKVASAEHSVSSDAASPIIKPLVIFSSEAAVPLFKLLQSRKKESSRTKTADADRHNYYRRNRAKILAKNRAWRMANPTKIKRYQSKYRRQVAMGQRRQRNRVDMGGRYTFTGVKLGAVLPTRPKVPGLIVPRTAMPKILPHAMGRNKGTTPVNPFSGNMKVLNQVKKAGFSHAEKALLALTAAYAAKKSGDAWQTEKTPVIPYRPRYSTMRAARGLAEVLPVPK